MLQRIHAYEAPSLLSDATVEIGGLIVAKSSRKQGVGKALMTAVETWTRTRGFNEVLLASREDRLDAHAFYTAIGYSLVHKTLFFVKDLDGSGSKH
jgi:GNAT superfamily N-acetyltransferase